jgi:hypothetical protein
MVDVQKGRNRERSEEKRVVYVEDGSTKLL